MQTDYETIKKAIGFLQQHAASQPSLAEMAEYVELSPAYFQRLFRRWAGVSPKRVLQFLNAAKAKRMLRESKPILDISFELGLSGPGRLHDLIVSSDGVTPGEWAQFGQDVEIQYGWHDSPFGKCLIGTTQRGICILRFADSDQVSEIMQDFEQDWPFARKKKDQKETAIIAKKIFSDSGESFLLHLKGTNFQLKVWEGLLRIPDGCLTSYSDLAIRIGESKGTRAVANAVGANPVAWVIPCHRVLRSTGELGGYRWGLERKVSMLAWELARKEDRENS